MGGQFVIFTSLFSQSISGLYTANHGIPNITSVFPRLYTSILTLFICPLKNILHSTWCIIVPPTFTVLFIFLINGRVFSLSKLNFFFFYKLGVHKQLSCTTIK